MNVFQGLLFLVFGLGLLGVDWFSLRTGWLPCGPKGLKGRLEFTRAGHPIRYWTMFVVYGVSGVYLLVFSLRLLSGLAEPLPLN